MLSDLFTTFEALYVALYPPPTRVHLDVNNLYSTHNVLDLTYASHLLKKKLLEAENVKIKL